MSQAPAKLNAPAETSAQAPGAQEGASPAAALLARCAAGDRDAFSPLYELMAPRIFGLVRAVLGPGTRAEDALQEAMWEIWRRAASYSPALGPAEAWMLMLARSRAIDLLRRERRAAELKQAFARTVDHEAHAPSPASRVRPEALDACDRALRTLAPEQAAVIRLAYLRGLSREEIAAALDIPVGTVKTRIRSGVRTMTEALAAGQVAGGEAQP